jgi:predicted nucleic-acid-binding Zn-ribbon protein
MTMSESWTCPQCGSAVDTTADRCWACKQPRLDPEATHQSVPTAVPEVEREFSTPDDVTASIPETASDFGSIEPSSAPSEITSTRPGICPKCGETIDAGFLVCWSCGTSIDGIEDPTFVRVDEDALGDDESPTMRFPDDDREELEAGPAQRLCLRCQGPLEPGFIADFQHTGMQPSEWVAGTPQPSFWTGTWTGDRRFPIQAWRCWHCGHLEFWAGEPSERDPPSRSSEILDE